jgi:glucose-6-phosphate isomerase
MDDQGNVRGERMFPGSLHYIPGRTAHRVANTSDTSLSFGACWPSNAGHNYGTIEKNGFTARLKKLNGKPQFV